MDRKLSLTQLDALKEAGTIGAGRAATALADLISKKVQITVPQVNLIPIENISTLLTARDRTFFVIDMEITGYISALADMTNLNMLISSPSLALDMVGAILDFIFIQIAQYSEEALIIKTDLKVSDVNLEGLFLFFPSTDSLKRIFESLGLH